MSEYCIVVAEGSRARFFTLEPADIPELESGPNLVEHVALANPEHQAHNGALWSETRAGRNRTAHGAAHGYDDHRQQHSAEMERRFARNVVCELDRMARGNGTRKIVICAEKQMLGFLRSSISDTIGHDVEISEVAKDLTKLPLRDLHARLAAEGHIPRRKQRLQ